MTKFNVQETIKRAEEEYGLGKGQYFKVQEGPNKIRLLSECVGYQGSYQGKPTFKFVCWVIDRRDNQIKLYFMPQTVLDQIGGLQASDDFKFEDVPMPYDISIMAKGAGTKEVEYTVVGARQNTDLTPEELKEFEGKPSIDEVIKKLKEKQSDEQQDQAAPQTAQVAPSPAPQQNQEGAGQDAPTTAPPNVDENVNVEDIPF
jgi:hypothetical protein